MKNVGIVELKRMYEKGETSPREATEYYLTRISKENSSLNAYLTVNEKAVEQAEKSDTSKKLGGIPIAVKDVFSTKNLRTTCSSKILENYNPVYESTVTQRTLDEGAIFLGKTNLDEFCHGSSTETSAYGATHNPWDLKRSPGGSSGGSAAATAADLCAGSLGTETAGSIRLPAAWCGCVGLKPTYGRVPRYGVLAMGSSLDSPGPITKNVEDAAYLLSIIAGKDEHDATTTELPVVDYFSKLDPTKVKGARLALPKEYLELELDPGVRKVFMNAIETLKSMGATIVETQLIDPKYSMAVYTILCRSEVSSNLSRYDGTRYCVPTEDNKNVTNYFEEVRGMGFGKEAKRRILTGIFSLSAGYSGQYYKKAEYVRQMLKDDVLNVLKDFDAIIGPSTATPPDIIGEAARNPLFGEMADILNETSSLTGLPGISIPCGLADGLPVGIQLYTRHFEEQIVLDIAAGMEKEFGLLTLPQ